MVKTLRTGIRVLRLLAEADAPVGVTEAATRLDIDKASAHRLLKTLVDEGLAERDPHLRRYSLGLGVVSLATTRLRQTSLTSCATPHMEALSQSLNETVALMIPDGRNLACAHVCESRRTVRVAFFLGERVPIHNTASGIAWLSSLSLPERQRYLEMRGASGKPVSIAERSRALLDAQRATKTGYAVIIERHQSGVGGVAAAIVDDSGRGIGSLVIAAEAPRLDRSTIARFGLLVREMSDRIGLEMSGKKPDLRRAG